MGNFNLYLSLYTRLIAWLLRMVFVNFYFFIFVLHLVVVVVVIFS